MEICIFGNKQINPQAIQYTHDGNRKRIQRVGNSSRAVAVAVAVVAIEIML